MSKDLRTGLAKMIINHPKARKLHPLGITYVLYINGTRYSAMMIKSAGAVKENDSSIYSNRDIIRIALKIKKG